MDLQRMMQARQAGAQAGPPGDTPQVDTSEQVYISSLALLKMLKHGEPTLYPGLLYPTSPSCSQQMSLSSLNGGGQFLPQIFLIWDVSNPALLAKQPIQPGYRQSSLIQARPCQSVHILLCGKGSGKRYQALAS